MPTDILIPPTVGIADLPAQDIRINLQWWAHVSGIVEQLTYRSAWDGTDDEISFAISEIAKFLNTGAPTLAVSVWTTEVPTISDSGDGDAVEIGARFHVETPGKIAGLRFYKDAANTGEHHGYLYDLDCNLLGELVFMDETASGWQSGLFDIPIAIQACQTYTASYHAPNGHYSKDPFGLSDAIVNPPITLNKSLGFPEGNGVYQYGAGASCPTTTYEDTNYWLDVIFIPD